MGIKHIKHLKQSNKLSISNLRNINIGKLLNVFGTLAILPFLLLSFFNHPLGVHEWDWITKMGGQLKSLNFWEMQWHAYNEWTGRYASTFISALTPYLYTITGFKLFFFFNFLVGFYLIYLAVRELLGIRDKWHAAAITFLVWVSYVAGVSGLYDTFYMLTGIQTYLFGGYAFLLLAIFWKWYFIKLKKTWINWGIIVLSLFSVGTNELTMFFTLGLAVSIFFYVKYYLKKNDLFILIISLLTLVFSIATILAPANLTRHIEYPGVFDPGNLTLLAIGASVFNLITWFVNGQLVVVSLIFILLIKDHLRQTNFSIKYIFTGFILTFLLIVFGGHLILIWALKAQSFGERIIDLIYFHFLLLWFLFLYLLAGKFRDQLQQYLSLKATQLIGYSLLIVFMLHVFGSGLHINRETKVFTSYFSLIEVNSNVGNAWLCLLKGDAMTYNKDMSEQYKLIAASKQDTVYLIKPDVFPAILYNVQSDRRNRENGDAFMGSYFNNKVKVVKYEGKE